MAKFSVSFNVTEDLFDIVSFNILIEGAKNVMGWVSYKLKTKQNSANRLFSGKSNLFCMLYSFCTHLTFKILLPNIKDLYTIHLIYGQDQSAYN